MFYKLISLAVDLRALLKLFVKWHSTNSITNPSNKRANQTFCNNRCGTSLAWRHLILTSVCPVMTSVLLPLVSKGLDARLFTSTWPAVSGSSAGRRSVSSFRPCSVVTSMTNCWSVGSAGGWAGSEVRLDIKQQNTHTRNDAPGEEEYLWLGKC